MQAVADLIVYIQKYANIFVQNRITGKLEEEKMPVQIRLGISRRIRCNQLYGRWPRFVLSPVLSPGIFLF